MMVCDKCWGEAHLLAVSDTSKTQTEHYSGLVKTDCKHKPTPEQFGWHNQNGFDDEPSGWMLEGGEDAYYEALKKWNELIIE